MFGECCVWNHFSTLMRVINEVLHFRLFPGNRIAESFGERYRDSLGICIFLLSVELETVIQHL